MRVVLIRIALGSEGVVNGHEVNMRSISPKVSYKLTSCPIIVTNHCVGHMSKVSVRQQSATAITTGAHLARNFGIYIKTPKCLIFELVGLRLPLNRLSSSVAGNLLTTNRSLGTYSQIENSHKPIETKTISRWFWLTACQ